MSTPGRLSTDRPPRSDLCDAVIRGFEAWIDQYDPRSQGSVRQRLKRFICSHLRANDFRASADAVSVPRGTSHCDLVIDDRIGITIVYDLTTGSKEWIHRQLRTIFRKYDHLIVYGHQIEPEHLDVWHQIKRSLDRRSSRRNTVSTLQTIRRLEYRIPLTNRRVRKAVVHRSLAYVLFVAFVLVAGYSLGLTDGADAMARAYVGAVIVFNVVVVVLGVFLVRTL